MSKYKSQDNKDQVFPMKALREKLGISQVKFAAAIGIDPKTISRAENGLTEPVFTVLQMKRLCALTGITLNELPDYLGKDFLAINQNQNSPTF